MKRTLAAALTALAAFAVHAQDTIKIGVITDRVGVSKGYSEPAARGWFLPSRNSTRKVACSGARSSCSSRTTSAAGRVGTAARKLVD